MIVHWLQMGGPLRLVQRRGAWVTGWVGTLLIPLFAVQNVTAHPSRAILPTLYYLLYGTNVGDN